MPPRRCCCGAVRCELGDDNFNRSDANPPSGKWRVVSGEYEIADNVLNTITEGVLATTICHASVHDEGSFIANFRLVDMRTRSIFKVRAGKPDTSAYEVHFEPMDVDTPGAQIKITVIGDETVVQTQPWPVFGGNSVNETDVFICYQPGVMLRGSIGSFGGQPPVPGACVSAAGASCWTIGGVDVGNFSFIDGAFDNWDYRVTATDDLRCDPCGCFCLKGEKPEDVYDPDKACFPSCIRAIFELVSSDVYAGACQLNDFEVVLTTTDTERTEWLSATQDLCGTTFALKAICQTFDDGDRVWRALSLQIFGSAGGGPGSSVFQWDGFDSDAGETANNKNPDYEESTCDPLSLVYNGLKLACFFGNCGDPDDPTKLGHIPFCCTDLCLESCPNIIYRVTLVEC
jgi:hypothetical protein